MIGFGLFPTWSPNKRTGSDRVSEGPGAWIALVQPLDAGSVDGEARRVTEIAVSSNAAIVSPAWSPDGKRLSFATVVEPAQNATGKPRGQQDIWTVNADGTNRHRITDGNGICATPYWAADNRIYFVSDRGGTECIWSARAEQGNISTAGVETKELAELT